MFDAWGLMAWPILNANVFREDGYQSLKSQNFKELNIIIIPKTKINMLIP